MFSKIFISFRSFIKCYIRKIWKKSLAVKGFYILYSSDKIASKRLESKKPDEFIFHSVQVKPRWYSSCSYSSSIYIPLSSSKTNQSIMIGLDGVQFTFHSVQVKPTTCTSKHRNKCSIYIPLNSSKTEQ